MALSANTSGWALASSTVSGSSGQPGLTGAYPAAANTAAHRSQLLGSSQRPWMNTTGLRPESLACAICADREIAEGAVELLMATSLVDSGRLIIRNPTYVAARPSPPIAGQVTV